MNRKFIVRSLYVLTLVAAAYLAINYGINFIINAVFGAAPDFFSYDNPIFTQLGITSEQMMTTFFDSITFAIAYGFILLSSLVFALLWNIYPMARGRKSALKLPAKGAALRVVLTVLAFLVLYGVMLLTVNQPLLLAQFLLIALYWEYRWGGYNLLDREAVYRAAPAEVVETAELPEELKLFPDEEPAAAGEPETAEGAEGSDGQEEKSDDQ